MKDFNIYKVVLFVLLLLCFSCLVCCLAGCAEETAIVDGEKLKDSPTKSEDNRSDSSHDDSFDDSLDDSLDDSFNDSLDDSQDYLQDNPLDISNIVFSTEDLEPVFQIVIGDKWHNYYGNQSQLLYLRDFIGDNPCPEKFWLISPFYEPKEFFLRDYDDTEPIKLSALAQTMTFKPIEVKKSNEGWKLDPFVSFRYTDNDWAHLYSWASEQMLKIYSPPRGVGLVSIDTEEPIAPSLFNYLNDNSLAVSLDNKMVAYIDKGFVVIKDLVTEEQNKWALTKDPESQSFQTFSTEFLSWSPNGRYLAGSNYAYYDNYLAKVWVLDLQTGKLKHFNTMNTHAFLDPIWSPNSDQVVVSEYFRPYSEDFYGQWIMLDIPSLKVISIAGRDNYDTNYEFFWDNGNLQFSTKHADTIQAFSLYNDITQNKNLFATLNRVQEGEEIVSEVKLSPDERYIALLKTKPFSDNLVMVSLEIIDLQLFNEV